MTDFFTLIVAGIIGEAIAVLVPVLVIVVLGVVGLYSLDEGTEPPAPRPAPDDDTNTEEW